VEIEFKNGVYHLSGRLDEYSELDSLVSAPDPLKLNLGKIESINSIGVRRFLAFVIDRGSKKFEFYECTADFIANVNVIPQMLGTPSDARQIKSFFIPYSCESCKIVEHSLLDFSSITLDEVDEVELASRICSKCAGEMDLDVEKSEFFYFLSYLPKTS